MMRFSILGLAVLSLLVFSLSVQAQNPEPPLTWKGAGEATIHTLEGEMDIDFDLEFHVDADGMVSGKTTNNDSSTVLEKFYFGEEVRAQSPALKSRKLVMVFKLDRSDSPWLIILEGTVLGNKHFFGDLRLTTPDVEGMKEALNLGDKSAVEMSATTLPAGLKKAIDKSALMGYFEVEGKMVSD